MKKIGIMGGTFDPIHIGHLLLGQMAYESFQLDEVWFLPNGNPPHKNAVVTEEALKNRIEMTKIAIQQTSYFKLSLFEAKIGNHSYTYKTMGAFQEKYPDTQFYFILGADSLFAIEEWKHFREIFPTCIILAAMRDDKDIEEMEAQIRYLEMKYQANIELLRAPLLEISSTTIRERVLHGLSITYMVPENVEKYIYDNHLYKSEEYQNVIDMK